MNRQPPSIPIWRDTRYIAILLQILFVVGVVVLMSFLCTNLLTGLERSGIPISWRFLQQPAGIAIGEGLNYEPTDSYLQAFFVGLYNTLRVAIVGIILATLLGLAMGILRLSNNWLLRTVTYGVVEVVRNTPVLLQLFFWLAVAQFVFPVPQQAYNLGNFLVLSNRGVWVAWPRGTEFVGLWWPFVLVAVVLAVGVHIYRQRLIQRRDRPGLILPYSLGTFFAVLLLSWLTLTLVGRAPLYLDMPVLNRFNYNGGVELSAFYFATLAGLVVYTAAYISEIVRGGILAVSKGQREASRALGLTEWQSLRLIILPQAMRIIVPPLINQYLNLSKNSSLAIAIGYPDLFNVSYTIFNQTGQTIPVLLMVMISYLTISLAISLILNIYNQRIQIVER